MVRRLRCRLLLAGPLVAVVIAGCTTHEPLAPSSPAAGIHTAPPGQVAIRHIVLIKLKDPSARAALDADCTRLLPAIPGVCEYSLSHHLDIGRANVDGNYDTALIIGLTSVEAYREYLVHENHKRLLADWKDRIETLRIFDFAP